jgi:hypothetical protein
MITYITLPNKTIQVKLDNRVTGGIKVVPDGFAYFPVGSKLKGETFPTVEDVKKSLEEE